MHIKLCDTLSLRRSLFFSATAHLWVILWLYYTTNTIMQVAGQAIIPFIPRGNDLILRSFLDPCETITLQTQCTEEEYESNEDCLPQKTDNCDHSKELFCLSGVCLPNCHPHKETYDRIEGKCFRKVGSDCRSPNVTTTVAILPTTNQAFSSSGSITSDTGESSSSSHASGLGGGVIEETTRNDNGLLASEQEQHSMVPIIPECEKNAVCERGQCRCARGYTYDHNFNKCILYAGYSGYCNDTVNCDRKSDIVCWENQCQCKSLETQYFHLKRKRCYILIGQVCSNGLQFCPDNSNCVRKKSRSSKHVSKILPIIPTSEPERTTYSNSGHTRLRRLYDELVSGEYDGDNQEEDHFIGILGEDEEGQEFVCKCAQGYGMTRDKRFCLGLHGTRCNTLHRCNTERNLKCFNGTCLCEREREGEQVYDEVFQTCITLIGAKCIGDGKGERETDICPIGASCRREENGTCACDEGFTPSPAITTTAATYSCKKGHGMSCKNNNHSSPQGTDPFQIPCNLEIGLECSVGEEKCLCKDSSQFYIASEGKCEYSWVVDRKIPGTHFTPPDDREYTFRRNLAASDRRMSSFQYFVYHYLIIVSVLLFSL